MTRSASDPDILPRTVLLADDNVAVRETIAEFLAAQGCEVLQAANGVELLFQVKRTRPAVSALSDDPTLTPP